MKRILAVLAGGLLIGAFAASHAELPPPTPEEKAAAAAKAFHNFIAPLFIVSVLAMIVLFVKDNLPRLYDLKWFARAWAVGGGSSA